MDTAPYVELHCHSGYSFLDGASHPEELALRAAELGYGALALTDHEGVYGSLEFAHAAKVAGVRPLTGAEVTLGDVGSTEPHRSAGAGVAGAGAGAGAAGAHVTLLVESAAGYANLCRLLTAAHAHTRPEGRELREPLPPALDPVLLAEHHEGLVCLSGCARDGLAVRDPNRALELARIFGRDRFYVELQRPFERGDVRRNALLRDVAAQAGVHTVVTGNVHAHDRRRTPLQDVLVAIRHRTSLDGSERERRGNRESVLRPPTELLDLFPGDRDAVRRTVAVAERLEFDLTAELGYRYPDFSNGAEPAIRRLAQVCEAAFADRYPPSDRRLLGRARTRLREELALIDELGLAGFFLLHWEVLELARECADRVRGRDSPRRTLPPGRGRGSSVGSIVCYLTGLSHVDPVANGLSLGRFLNRELASVPDIDLDFPRDIRELLIVAVTERYGREHAALVASFATYRGRGAIRDIGKALGLPAAELERLARVTDGWSAKRVADDLARLPDAERKLLSPRWRAFAELTAEIGGLPRHVSQHPGGMVISSRPLVELVPVQPAAMAGRQLCQWDKDSCSDAGFLKIDLLGLGMLSAVEDCVDRVAEVYGAPIDLSRIPLDDPAVYAEIQRADTVGDFQIESRAQMQSLLRTRPESLDDLTVQVALVRPGPIQGKAVHPYIDARERRRIDPSYVPPVDHELLREPLRETHGVVVFQDQVLEVAMALAGFTIGEAEGLRRAMSRKRSEEAIEAFRERFVAGAAARGVDAETADRVYDKLAAFSGFGFPKSHAAAFGLLAYQSAWLRHHYPAEFLCALLNAQPMGFYPPASLVRDAQRRGVEVRAPDVNLSEALCGLEEGAVRLGLGYVTSLGEHDAERLVAERDRGGPFCGVGDLARRAPLDARELEALVRAGACDRWGSRRDLLWQLGLVRRPRTMRAEDVQLTLELAATVATPELRELTEWERMLADYRGTSVSVDTHPLTLLRPHLPRGVLASAELNEAPHRSRVAFAGLAVARQRPATARGVVFMLLEDESGQVNLIVPPEVYEQHRAVVRGEPLLLVRGRFERIGENRNVVVDELESLGPLARRVADADVGAALPPAHHFGHR
ncbi:MAG TPA: error-prone DNA polymerase [Gaiellaceae bacterium]|nr:error-prone DNA polymerase [Gaiellaceae bacterium]